MHNSWNELQAECDEVSEEFARAIPLQSEQFTEGFLVTAAPDQTDIHGDGDAPPVQRSALLRFASRTLDILGSSALIVFLAPVLLGLTILIGLTCGGSPIFAHRRVGKGGRPFNCYKFRSMKLDAEAQLERLLKEDPALRREWKEHRKLANDPRITPFGQFLRRTSLDELPQLLNVLIGDMSLVGPRPVVRAELAYYGRFLPSYLALRPGLTGLWQVTCRSQSSYRRRVAIDHVYARRKCLLLDIRILIATLPAVLTRKGAC